jgi:hypothetical protein
VLLCACGGQDDVQILDGGAPDLAASVDQGPDIKFCGDVISCMDLIACINACTTAACITKCHKMAPPVSNALEQALDGCINAACVGSPDAGAGPCAGTAQQPCNACVSESQTGTSSTGAMNGACTDGADGGASAPVCGACVDQLLACLNQPRC